MLLIQAKDAGGRDAILAFTPSASGRGGDLRLYRQTKMTTGVPQGDLLGSIQLSDKDLAELRKAL